MSFGELFERTKEVLVANQSLIENYSVEAEATEIIITAYQSETGKSLDRTELFLRHRETVPGVIEAKVLKNARARSMGKMLQHITGRKFFLNHEYEVNEKVLIPRPETELLVSLAINEFESTKAPLLGLEIGLGSGNISIELLSQVPTLTMISTEICGDAIEVASRNAAKILGEPSGRLMVCKTEKDSENIFSALMGVLGDFLVSNPPYLNQGDPIEQDVKDQEPVLALYAPEGDPLYFYRSIAARAEKFLKPGAPVFVELPHFRASEIENCFKEFGWHTKIFNDLNLRPRILRASKAGN